MTVTKGSSTLVCQVKLSPMLPPFPGSMLAGELLPFFGDSGHLYCVWVHMCGVYMV